MMNMQTAINMSTRIAELMGLCSAFQAKFGTHYTLKPGSTHDAWDAYNVIVNKQAEIAAMLDPLALQSPHITLGKWWERTEIPELSTISRLMDEVTRLIGACAYCEMQQNEVEVSYTVKAAQSVIAGLLHPSARVNASQQAQHRVG